MELVVRFYRSEASLFLRLTPRVTLDKKSVHINKRVFLKGVYLGIFYKSANT